MNDIVIKNAWKWTTHGDLVHCEWNDPKAARFNLSGPWTAYSGDSLEFSSRLRAEDAANAIVRAVELGKSLVKQEMRDWLGVGQ